MSDKNFVKEYLEDFSSLIKPDDKIIQKIIEAKEELLKVKNNGSKIMIVGNGGSAAIASHFSVDITKNAKIRAVNFNEADLITCFANDCLSLLHFSPLFLELSHYLLSQARNLLLRNRNRRRGFEAFL